MTEVLLDGQTPNCEKGVAKTSKIAGKSLRCEAAMLIFPALPSIMNLDHIPPELCIKKSSLKYFL